MSKSIPAEMATHFGHDSNLRTKDAWAWGLSVGGEPTAKVAIGLLRTHATKVGHGIYRLPKDFSEIDIAAPVQRVQQAKASSVPSPHVAMAATVTPLRAVSEQPTASEVRETREFSRIRSSDLTYQEITIPQTDNSFVPFGVFQTVTKLLKSGVYAPMYIVGDSGYGKTMAVEQACARAKRPLVVTQITNETSEDDLIGGLRLIDGDSVFEYGPVIRAFREGAVLLLDEVDQGTTALMCLQNILQRKPYQIKKTGETIYPHPNFMVVATGNTKGLGDDVDGKFIGAQLLNEAMLERFSCTVEQFAPTKSAEEKILRHIIDDETFIKNLVHWATMTREAKKQGAVKREIQTRRLVHIATNYNAFGDKRMAISLALGRFDQLTAETMLMLYERIDAELTSSTTEVVEVEQG